MMKTVWVGFILIISQSAQSENLMGVYRKALMNDPQLLAAGYAHAAAGESIKEAKGRMLPLLGFEYSQGTTNQEIIKSDNPFQPTGEDDFPTTDYSLTLTQPVFNWGLYAGYKQARADTERADAEFISVQQDLMLRTAQAYLGVLGATDEVDFAGTEKMAVQQQLELVESRMSAGMARKTELFDAQARYASIEADLIGAYTNLDNNLQALREIVGELSGDLARLKPNLKLVYPEPRNPESWMQAAIEQNPRVQMQIRAVQSSRHEVSLQNSGHVPTLDLTARINNRETKGNFVGNGTHVENRDLILRLNVPIYQGGIVNSRTRRSVQMHLKAQQDLTAMQRAVQRSARAAYHGIISAISKVSALETSVRAQELALESKQAGYRSGLYTNLNVLDAERDLHEVKRDHARARYEYLLNSLGLKHAVGTLNEADLEGVDLWLQFVAKTDFNQGLQTENKISLIVRPTTGNYQE
jgi:outer membrane protein